MRAIAARQPPSAGVCRRPASMALFTTIVLAGALSACGQRSGVAQGSASGGLTSTSAPISSRRTTPVATRPFTAASSQPVSAGPLVVLPPDLEGGLDAQVRGKVVFRGTCVYLNLPPSHGGPKLRRVVWPTGTTWQERPRAVVLPNGEVLREGDPVLAGGGFVRDFELGLYIGDDLATRSFECDDATGSEVLNNDLSSWPD